MHVCTSLTFCYSDKDLLKLFGLLDFEELKADTDLWPYTSIKNEYFWPHYGHIHSLLVFVFLFEELFLLTGFLCNIHDFAGMHWLSLSTFEQESMNWKHIKGKKIKRINFQIQICAP